MKTRECLFLFLFDPCPAGWRVPLCGSAAGSPWSAFTTTNGPWEGTGISSGRRFNNTVVYGGTAWYLACGWRDASGGTVVNIGHICSWSATAVNDLWSTSTFIYVSAGTQAANGMPVRCIRE